MQCSAHSKLSGNQCRRDAIIGGTVCYVHGGAAPQVKRAARERLERLIDPALEVLAASLEDGSDSVRLSAAKDILDRVGLKPALLVGSDPENPLMPDASGREQIEARIASAIASIRASEDPGRPQ